MYTYIHIPFCKSKCSYCDFFSVVSNNKKPWGKEHLKNCSSKTLIPDEYIQALIKDAAYQVKKHAIKKWSSLYIGGGTPGLLTSEQVSTLFAGLKKLCPIKDDAEITFEVNPYEIAQAKAKSYLDHLSNAGINRISCGIQSLRNTVLQTVSRRSNESECRNALQNLVHWRANQNKTASSSNRTFQFSVDIIAGLPKLSSDDFLHDLHEIIAYKPDHISLYSLMIEENTPLNTAIEKGDLYIDTDDIDSQWVMGKEVLKKHGYYQYEVSNFAQSYNRESEHNKAYWRMDDYIGIGCTACGTVKNTRYTGTNNIQQYCSFWNSYNANECSEIPITIYDRELLSEEDMIFEFLMMGFRTLKGVRSNEFQNRFNVPLEDRLGASVIQWEEKGFLRHDKKYYALTEQGILFLNSFLNDIL